MLCEQINMDFELLYPMSADSMSKKWTSISSRLIDLLKKQCRQLSCKERRELLRRWLSEGEELTAGVVMFSLLNASA